jgi:ferredoxin-type protein NapH
MIDGRQHPGAEAVETFGWFKAHRWLIARRTVQFVFLAVFLTGPLFGLWITKGTLAASKTLGVLPLTDPFIALQSLFAGHIIATTGLIGAAIVLATYALIGGRVYCAWVCPINPVTDAAYWLREKLAVGKGWQPERHLRYWLMGGCLLAALITGVVAWEAINPITMLHRGLVFGTIFVGGLSWLLVVAVFLFDVFISRRGWCGHVCPVGAFYGLVGRFGLLRITAWRRADCDDCMDCFAVCPEPHVITPALRGQGDESPIIASIDCSNCGRCIDVCSKSVYRFSHRFDMVVEPASSAPGVAEEKRVA